MVSKITSSRTIKAVIKGTMEKQGTRGPYLDVQLLREGMRFPETLKCWDMKQLEHVKLNSTVSLILNRDNVKAGKEDDGETGSYWWSIAGVADSRDDAIGPEVFELEQPPRKQPQREEPPPLPQALGACQNHAMAFIESGIIPVPEGRDPINFLWELRDRVYRNVNQKPYQPEGFCYGHLTMYDRTEKSQRGAKYHVVENGYCVLGVGFVAKDAQQ